jgi:Transposase zinc-ribbon domain
MNDTPLTLFQFQKRYRTERDCEQAIIKMRWPNGFICPKCAHVEGYRLKSRRAIQCTLCRHQTSITAGTIFHKSKLPLLKWFWMIFLVAHDKGGASALRLSKQLGMYYKTVWYVLHKIREAMARRDEKVIQLGGSIEMDEAFFGHYQNKVQFLVMVEAEKKSPASL